MAIETIVPLQAGRSFLIKKQPKILLMDAEVLSRIQFAFTIAFHYIYPPLSIGLGLLLVVFEGMYLKTGNKIYEQTTRFWIKIFPYPPILPNYQWSGIE